MRSVTLSIASSKVGLVGPATAEETCADGQSPAREGCSHGTGLVLIDPSKRPG